MPASGLLAACDDPQLLGSVKLWPKQREILRAVEGGPRLHVQALGRRSSKTYMAALVALWDACLRPDLARHLRPGERRYAVCVANNLAQAQLFVRYAREIVEASPLLRALLVSATDDALDFSTNVTVAAFPCSARGGRGWAISTLLLDEYAHHVDGQGNSADAAVWKSMTPSTAQFGTDARVIVASTPFGTGGMFAQLFERAQAGEIDGAAAHHYTSAEMNPELDSAFLSAELALDPEMFRGEYLAEFQASGGAYLDAQRIAECVGRSDLGRLDILDPILGVDLGFTSDPAACVVLGKDPAHQGTLLVAMTRRWEPAKSRTFEERRHVEDTLLADICEIAYAYGLPGTRACSVVLDQYLSEPVKAFFQKRAVPVKVLGLTATTKSLAFAELKDRIYARSIELPDDAELLGELRGLRTQFKAGSSTVVTPRTSRGHSDLAVALALAAWEQRHVGTSEMHAEFHRAEPLHYGAPADSVEALAWELPGASRLSPDMRL
jgi:hypothetical protein